MQDNTASKLLGNEGSTMVKKKIWCAMLSLCLFAGCSGGQREVSASAERPLSSVQDGDAVSAHVESTETEQTYIDLFEGDRVVDVYVTIGEDDWQSILDTPREKEYKSVDVVFDGIALENVGFSTKGNSSLSSVARSESERYSFRLKFDKYNENQTLLGLDKLSLNNNFKDPSYMREYLHYEAMRESGAPVPLTIYANLYINGDLHGLYTCVEHQADSFLRRNFGEDWEDGVFYDTEDASTLEYVEGSRYESLVLDSGTDDNRSSLIRFVKVLSEMPDGEKGEIESVLNVDSALRYIAANAVFGNYDSYHGGFAHNYRLYGNRQGVFTVVPWDMNESFGRFGHGGAAQNAVTISIFEPVQNNVAIDNRPLIRNLLAVREYRERYVEFVALYANYLEGVESRANDLAELIRPYVEADPNRFYSMEEFEQSLVPDGSTSYLISFANSRRKNLREQLRNAE